jgi:hypothetical protein
MFITATLGLEVFGGSEGGSLAMDEVVVHARSPRWRRH